MSTKKRKNEIFRKFAHKTSDVVGSGTSFIVALTIVIGWLASGPLFNYSDTWQLVINTATTIITFLMVFLIQSSQNRDAVAFHLKLDELIRAVKGARNELVDLEDLSDEEIKKLKAEFKSLHSRLESELTERSIKGTRRSHS